MHGLKADLAEIDTICAVASTYRANIDLLICPPATLIAEASRIAASRIAIGGQDCHPETAGPHTGDLSTEMLKDAGASAVIAGHSERRRGHGETNAMVAAKARAVQRAGLLTIICVGETQRQRSNGEALSICGGQIVESVPIEMTGASLAIGYEPLWAIGSGRLPTSEEIVQMHGHIRKCLVAHLGPQGDDIRILYGGSVNSADAGAILTLPGVDGALVGGASLKAKDFLAIVERAPARLHAT